MATASTFAGTITKYPIGGSEAQEKWVYTAAAGDQVAAATQETFILPSLGGNGKISEIAFETATSTDCNIWTSELDQDEANQKATNNETIIALDGINIGYSPELTRPRCFANRESVQVPQIYFTVDNDDGANATGAWVLVITYDRT